MTASISLNEMTKYRTDLFDLLQLPVPPIDASAIGILATQLRAAWTIAKPDFVDYLCFRCMGLTIAVPNADFLKAAIGTWSGAHIHEWQRLFDTLFYKYNPLWNKEANTDETTSGTGSKTDHEETTGNAQTDDKITGYTHGYDGGAIHQDDGLTWSHAEKTVSEAETDTSGERDFTSDTENEGTRHEHIAGNIGVTTYTDMISGERELAKFSIEDYIADEFIKHFMLMTW